jgi:ATP diphosphatase
MSTEKPKDIRDLLEVMAALRTPVTGCPWDLEQDFRSIAPYTLEEAYEVADAIERGDLPHLKEELGDLLLQVVYHSRLAEEQGAFAFPDVVDGITTKMIRRHPHVFGDEAARSAGAAVDFWEKAKAAEKASRSAPTLDAGGAPSLLADVPVGLPGLTRALKLQSKAARVGFDWPSIDPVFDKIREEITELQDEVAAATTARTGDRNREAVEDELGDLLFVMANLARHLEIDPEAALRRANEKFVRRFRHIERRLAEQSRTPAQSDLAQMDKLWDEAKALDKSQS